MLALEYSQWRDFYNVIINAMEACESAGQSAGLNFHPVGKNGPGRPGKDPYNYRLSKYAMLLVVQKADSTKTVPAEGQTYQAVQTHRADIIQETGDLVVLGQYAHRPRTLTLNGRTQGLSL